MKTKTLLVSAALGLAVLAGCETDSDTTTFGSVPAESPTQAEDVTVDSETFELAVYVTIANDPSICDVFWVTDDAVFVDNVEIGWMEEGGDPFTPSQKFTLLEVFYDAC